jgi:uncharacterized lipoprotein NlpE involved in copper resistance
MKKLLLTLAITLFMYSSSYCASAASIGNSVTNQANTWSEPQTFNAQVNCSSNVNITGNLNTGQKIWQLLTPACTVFAVAQDTWTFSVDGDVDLELKISIQGSTTVDGSTVALRFNGDSTYNYTSMMHRGTNIFSSTNACYIPLTGGGINCSNAIAFVTLDSSYGIQRSLLSRGYSVENVNTYLYVIGGTWKDTASNIASLSLSAFSSAFSTGTVINVWKRQ